MPAAFRRGLPDGQLVVTLLDQCLAAFPPAEWVRLEAQLRALPAFSKPVKALTRLLASRAADCELDVQGRILLPMALRAAAGLQKDVLVVGVLSRIEVWAPSAWDAFLHDSERLLDDVSLEVQWPLSPVLPAPAGEAERPQGKPSR